MHNKPQIEAHFTGDRVNTILVILHFNYYKLKTSVEQLQARAEQCNRTF